MEFKSSGDSIGTPHTLTDLQENTLVMKEVSKKIDRLNGFVMLQNGLMLGFLIIPC